MQISGNPINLRLKNLILEKKEAVAKVFLFVCLTKIHFLCFAAAAFSISCSVSIVENNRLLKPY